MRNNVRRITDGAVMAAIMGLLIVLDGQSGMLLDGLLFWVIPIPIIVYTVKYNLSSGVMVSFAVTILAFIITLPHLAVLIAFSNLIGLAYGFGVNKKLKSSQTLLITFIVTLAYYVISLIVFAGFFGYDAIAELNAIMEFFTKLLGNFVEEGVDMLKVISFVNPFVGMIFKFPLFIPATIALLQTVITNLVCSVILKRLDLADIKIKPIFSLKISKKVGLITLIVLIITYVYSFSTFSAFDNVIILVQFIAQLIFIVMGVVLSMTYIAVKKLSILSVFIALITIIIPLLMFIIGVIDVFSNVRVNMIRRVINER